MQSDWLKPWRERAKKSLLCDFGRITVFSQLGLYKSELGFKKRFLDLCFRLGAYVTVAMVLIFICLCH